MRVVLVADAYPPMRSSGAVQLRDLSAEFARQGHDVTVLVASPGLPQPWSLESWNGVQVVRLRTPRTKDVGYVRRTMAEALMPFAMRRNLRRSPLAAQAWEGVVWYSPTIFFGPLVRALKRGGNCRGYLILRDIFPEWAVDMGLMGRGLAYRFFRAVADYQYSVADVIGIQTAGNASYFEGSKGGMARVEVLHNWLAEAPEADCSIRVADTPLQGRKLLVYAGNMGVAQGMDILLDLADRLQARQDIALLFVGRGSDAARLREEARRRGLANVAFFDEIDPGEIPGLYAQCHVGMVALDPRHRTHNIPGKFLSYMQAGLPVLASVNASNDLVGLIESARVGRVCTDANPATLKRMAEDLVDGLAADVGHRERCRALSARLFAPEVAVRQIVRALQP